MGVRRIDGTPPDPIWTDRLAAGWQELAGARARLFARLQAQSASWTAVRRLPARAGGRYDRRPAGQGDGARSQ